MEIFSISEDNERNYARCHKIHPKSRLTVKRSLLGKNTSKKSVINKIRG